MCSGGNTPSWLGGSIGVRKGKKLGNVVDQSEKLLGKYKCKYKELVPDRRDRVFPLFISLPSPRIIVNVVAIHIHIFNEIIETNKLLNCTTKTMHSADV
jgi:hypothetical protein